MTSPEPFDLDRERTELATLLKEIKMLPWPSPTTLAEAIIGLRECSWWVCDRLSDPPISRGWKYCADENEAFIIAHVTALEAERDALRQVASRWMVERTPSDASMATVYNIPYERPSTDAK